ncbi:zinc ABC transporter substrate-binding protein [Jeotgalicoccus halotolerans]|uniref:metal ABC transporter solute-binding protein, Zn/Mn family n=1 Tax=Jeotgalicoccus halotolerans TaxID=157227 RepID=UPI0035146CD6
MRRLNWMLLFAAVIILTACSSDTEDSDKLKIYTTVYPLEYIISEIGGDTVETESILPPGADGHSYEPTSQEMLKYADGDGVVYVGEGMEAFSENIADALGSEETALIKIGDYHELFSGAPEEFAGREHEADDDFIEGMKEHYHTGDTVELSASGNGDKIEWAAAEGKDEFEVVSSGEEFKYTAGAKSFSVRASIYENGKLIAEDIADIKIDNHDSFDPHIWIDPLKMIETAEILKDELIKLNEDEETLYQENYEKLVKELTALDEEFSDVLSSKKNAKIIVPHAAFGYWQRYGVKQIPVSGYSMSDEPSQQQLSELLKTAEDNDLKYVLFEQNSPGRISEVIQEEIGAEAEYIHNMEVRTEADIENQEDYISLMKRNLGVLDKVTE